MRLAITFFHSALFISYLREEGIRIINTQGNIYDLYCMKVVITSATEKEIQQVKQALDSACTAKDFRLQISFLETGVGILSSCYSIAEHIFLKKPDLIIQAGIAGSFDEKDALGKVVIVKDEFLADTGVEENEMFRDVFDLNLQQENLFPFQNKALSNPWIKQINYLQLEEVTGVTVNEITTRPERIKELKRKYHPAVESMEGAALHYCCLKTSTQFIQIRATSNYIGERNKANWKFKEAFENLCDVVVKYTQHLNAHL